MYKDLFVKGCEHKGRYHAETGLGCSESGDGYVVEIAEGWQCFDDPQNRTAIVSTAKEAQRCIRKAILWPSDPDVLARQRKVIL